jgi:Spy/CpxP family protein refolding chaperone
LLALSPSVYSQTATNSTPPGERRAGRGGPTVENQLARLSEQLKLTDEQKPKVKVVLEEQSKQMQAIRELPQDERRPKMQAAREETTKKMKEILTPEQFKHYEEIAQQRGPRRGQTPPPGAPDKPAAKTNGQ